MRNAIVSALILLLPTFEGACSVPSSSAVYLRGEINTAKVEAALDLLRRRPGEFVITSAGGDPVAAMGLGRRLRALGSTVTVSGYCLSACATYVLAAAKETRIEKGALVGYHHTDTAILDVLETHLANPAPLKARSDAELAFMREMGSSPELLRAPLAAMRPICYDVFVPLAGQSYNGAVRTRDNLYVPSAGRLRQLGLKVSGENVLDDAGLAAWVRRYGRKETVPKVVFDGVTEETDSGRNRRLASTPPCGDSIQ